MIQNENQVIKRKGSFMLPFQVKVILTGLFGGFFGGLLGIGGSFLVIPLLSGPLGLTKHKAHASALPVAFVAGLSALGFYFSSGNFDLQLSLEVMLGSLVGVLLGTRLMRFVKGNGLSLLFGFFLFIVAMGFALQIHQPSVTEHAIPYITQLSIAPIALGFFAGIASGLFGAGGGTILVPGAVLLLHIGEQLAQGISLMAIIPTTLFGTWLHYREGNIATEVIPFLAVSAFGGGLIGGYLAIILHVSILKILLVFVLLYIGIRNIWRYWPRKIVNQ